MNSQPSSSEKVVRAQHRAARSVPPLNFVAAGLGVTLALVWLAHPTSSPVQNWSGLGALWLAGVALTLAGAVVFWQRRKRALTRSAAEVDSAFATHNRLETATALRGVNDPLAQAQRLETEQFLQQSKLAPRRRGLAMLMTLSAVLALAHLATLVCWARPVVADDSKARQDDPAVVAQENKKSVAPTASIEWQSPESETTATAIEEVPLEATADSTTGLRDAVLEISVNGKHKLSQPLKDDLSQPGKHTLKLSIYLDQLEVKTYDMVAYSLRAQRIHQDKLPPTVAPVQFIQVKPMREDTFICAGGDQPSKCFNYTTALKAAQLRLMKENFTLANAEISKTSDEWQDENSRVGADQTELSTRAKELIDLMSQNNYPNPILDLVKQSQPLMTDAGGKILKSENQPALEPQGKSLAYLTEVEKYLKHSIKLAGQSKQPKANDPFDKPKNLELKNHPLTRAGKVDKLAQEQSKLAGDLASGNTNSVLKLPTDDPQADQDQITGTPGERQAELKRRIEEMLDDPGFKEDALKHLQASAEQAGKSQEQLASQDLAAASEPAAEAARELRQTASALRADDGKQVKNELADALLRLSSAADMVRKAAQAKTDAEAAAQLQQAAGAVRESAKRLEAEARRQQANGSTNNTERLNEMAKLLRDEAARLDAQAQQSPRDANRSEQLAQRLDDMAERAAQLRNQGQPSRQELAKLIERMQRTQANLNRLASQCQNPGTSPGASPAAGKGQGQGQASSSSQQSLPGSGQPTSGGQTASQSNHQTRDGVSLSRAIGNEPGPAELQKQFAENLTQELREQTLDAMGVIPGTSELQQLRGVLKRHEITSPDGNLVAFAGEIDPPMTRVILRLREELSLYQRHYQLTDQRVAQAPPAYRPAVADYFEQLSQDYQVDRPAGQKEK
jgi:hypothetical protein